jgi:general secretion pathway protein E
VESFERELIVRYRIDGILYQVLTLPARLNPIILSRIKILGALNIAEKRLPQDGRFSVTIAGRSVDIRVSVIPTAHGERAVLRILEKHEALLDLEEIGLSPDLFEEVARLLHLSHGMVLVTGPTGSGKTTTLYASLSRMNSTERNILTIEDPVEYQLAGVGQIQVNPKINLTFANGLRSILRQDPDVVMVGEIRDRETAEIAIHASLTGHLVFSTLHTNDSAGAITRLIDMGIEPFLITSSVVAVMAQRLLRKICPSCRYAYPPTALELKNLGMDGSNGNTVGPFHRGAGCSACLQTGYHGRTGIYEILIMNDHFRAMTVSREDSCRIRQEAVKQGMKTLWEEGIHRVVTGETSAEEMIRVLQVKDVTPDS